MAAAAAAARRSVAEEEKYLEAHPLAGDGLTSWILDMVQQAASCEQLRRGMVAATRTLRLGTAELVILAADTEPREVLLPLKLSCEAHRVPFVFVASAAELCLACGGPGVGPLPVTACSISIRVGIHWSAHWNTQIQDLKDRIEHRRLGLGY